MNWTITLEKFESSMFFCCYWIHFWNKMKTTVQGKIKKKSTVILHVGGTLLSHAILWKYLDPFWCYLSLHCKLDNKPVNKKNYSKYLFLINSSLSFHIADYYNIEWFILDIIMSINVVRWADELNNACLKLGVP